MCSVSEEPLECDCGDVVGMAGEQKCRTEAKSSHCCSNSWLLFSKATLAWKATVKKLLPLPSTTFLVPAARGGRL